VAVDLWFVWAVLECDYGFSVCFWCGCVFLVCVVGFCGCDVWFSDLRGVHLV